MPRVILSAPTVDAVKNVRKERIQELANWISSTLEDYLAGRFRMEKNWADCLRMYEAIPAQEVKNTPIVNAPNLEVPIGMMAVDTFYSMSLQTIFNINPLVTVQAVYEKPEIKEAVKAMEDFVNWGTRHEFNPRNAANHAFMDNIQLGTGVFYIPWVTNHKKTKIHRIVSSFPQIQAWPIEDVIAPSGAFQNVDDMPLFSLRRYLTEAELQVQAKIFNWNTESVSPAAALGWIKSQREKLGKSQNTVGTGTLYEIHEIFCHYDIDGDGFTEDLMVTFDRASRTILSLNWNPYDRRPVEYSNYQTRAYLFYGMGIMEKLKNLQREVSDIHNYRNLNMLLANTRFWKVTSGANVPDNFMLWPNKQVRVANKDDITPEQMGDIYPSFPQAEASTMSIANRLVGLDEMQAGRPSALFSSRTPATTASLGISQQNQRFAAAFDSMHGALARSIKQCMFRYQEKLLAGNQQAEDTIIRVLGENRAREVVNLLRDPNFDEAVDVELTATSSRTTKEARLQGQIQLNQVMIQYYDRVLQLFQIATNPQIPSPMREAAKKISDAAGDLMVRTAREIDTIRDPESFVVRFGDELDRTARVADGTALAGLGFLTQSMDRMNSMQEQGFEPEAPAASTSNGNGNGSQ